jgi:large subunit ribosomal protein L2
MAIKTYKPTTPGRRGMTTQDTAMVTAKKPVRSLIRVKKSVAGRNNMGRITTRHRGGGVKKFYRLVNFKLASGAVAKVEAIEYDPNRSARIARVKDQHGLYHYLIAGNDMKVGQTISSGAEAPVESHNRLPLKNIPAGSFVYNIELQAGKGGQMVRSAGSKAQLVAKEGDYAQLRLPSGEVRKVRLECMASIGTVGNEQHQNIKAGSAGRRRHMGWRPSVHGKAMNPADHPMGGGEGKTGPGRIPKTPWGKVAIGLKTRRRKQTSKLIVRSRHDAKRK